MFFKLFVFAAVLAFAAATAKPEPKPGYLAPIAATYAAPALAYGSPLTYSAPAYNYGYGFRGYGYGYPYGYAY